MINGFEEETAILTEEEMKWIPGIVKGLIKQAGENHPVTSNDIIKGIEIVFNVKVGGSRIRAIIHYIRVNNLVPRLIATSKGYYIEKDNLKFKKYLESLMQRENSIREVREALSKQLNQQV